MNLKQAFSFAFCWLLRARGVLPVILFEAIATKGVQRICVSGVPNLIRGSRGSTCVSVAKNYIQSHSSANHPTCYRNCRDPTKRIMQLVCSHNRKVNTLRVPNCFKNWGMSRRAFFLSAYSIHLCDHHCRRCSRAKFLHPEAVPSFSVRASWPGLFLIYATKQIDECKELY
jgi:hypothetical protein